MSMGAHDALRPCSNFPPLSSPTPTFSPLHCILGCDERASFASDGQPPAPAPCAGVIEFDGSYVNYRHLAALVDSMTSR